MHVLTFFKLYLLYLKHIAQGRSLNILLGGGYLKFVALLHYFVAFLHYEGGRLRA